MSEAQETPPPASAPKDVPPPPSLWRRLRAWLAAKITPVRARLDVTRRRSRSSIDGFVGLGQLPGRILDGCASVWQWFGFGAAAPAPAAKARGGCRRTLSVAAAIFITYFALNQLLNWVEPFGLDAAAKQHSARISARLMAPFYRSSAQDHIAVVLIDSKTLQAREMGWPPQYTYYSDVLRRVLRQEPRAVYFDLTIKEERKYDDSLEIAKLDLEQFIADSDVPVWFGTMAPGETWLFKGVPGIAEAVAAWQGLGSQYPLQIAADNVLDHQGEKREGESVALSLYDAACVNDAAGCAEDAAALTPDARQKPITVFWGARHPARPPHAPQGDCMREADAHFSHAKALWQSLRGAWWSFRQGASPDVLDTHRERCPYTLTVYEHELDDPEPMWLKDRVVLIGTKLDGMDDTVPSPVHQRLPGVYLHAMALDNLMTWGERRLHARGVWFGRIYGVIVAMLVSLALAWILRHLAGYRRMLSLVALALLATLGSTVFQQWVLRLPPLDWLLGLGLFSLIVFAFMNRDDAVASGSKAGVTSNRA